VTDTVTRQDIPQTPARGLPRDLWLARTLSEASLLTPVQLAEYQAVGAGSVWEAAVSDGQVTDVQILQALSTRFRVPIADLSAVDPRVATLLPESVARKYQIVAMGADERKILIASADPRDLALEQTLAFVTGRSVEFLVAPPAGLRARIEEIYRPDTAINRLVDGLHPVSVEAVDELPAVGMRDPTLDAPMARLVDAMISDAVREGASDIHCEPLPECASVRYRIDGVLKEVMRLPASAGPALVRRVKILSKLDVTDPLRPHDGRTRVRVDGKLIDLRV
jgi:type IV pilus assembly protein PilB